jgi:hypothetical protein
MQAGPDGLLQEVRLREKQYALSRRTPPEIKMIQTSPGSGDVATEFESAIDRVTDMPAGWGAYFTNAAKKWHGPWDFNLFLSTLIAMGMHETGIRNIRQHDEAGVGQNNVVWHPRPHTLKDPGQPDTVIGPPAPGRTHPGPFEPESAVVQWKKNFVNEPGDFGVTSPYIGVGPMQLTSIGLKHKADDLLKMGYHDQYDGGRWHPEFNIMVAAEYLRYCLKTVQHDSGRDEDIWLGVTAYWQGTGVSRETLLERDSYANWVRNKVMGPDGLLGGVQSAMQEAKEAAQAQKDGDTGFASISLKDYPTAGLPTTNHIKRVYSGWGIQNYRNNPNLPVADRRQLIVAAAMWGYYHRDLISYSQPLRWGSAAEYGPPPDIPSHMDCSSFSVWCYKSAGCDDPNGGNFSWIGTTWSLIKRGKETSPKQAQPGDLFFYSSGGHVEVYVGYGLTISHGQESGPEKRDAWEGRDVWAVRSYL